MLASPEDMPSKAAKELPDPAKQVFHETYNADFAWRAQEAHALKAAWRAVRKDFRQEEDGSWVRIK
jgi:cation transport regulator ChaB